MSLTTVEPSSFYQQTVPLRVKEEVKTESDIHNVITPLRRSSRVSTSTRSVSAPLPASLKRKAVNRSDSLPVAVKKPKLEDSDEKPVARDIFQKQREAHLTRRIKYFWSHRALFEPLLPPASRVFEGISQQLQNTSNVHTVPFRQLEDQPKMITAGTLKDYQLHGLSFLSSMYKNGMNCILGDEMGLGKTLQTLSLFAWISENTPGPHAPHLVICPLSVLSSWLSEAKRWTPKFKTIRFHGSVSERASIKNELKATTRDFMAAGHFDIMVTTYDAYVSEDSWFKSRRWTMLVLDEGHKIKNADTVVSSKIQGLGSLGRLILTGTPIQNNLVELWSLLHFLYPTIFTPVTITSFEKAFNLNKGDYSLNFMDHAKKLLENIMLRRTKAVVEFGIPPRKEMDIFLPMLEYQRFWYLRLLTRLDHVNLKRIFQGDGKSVSSAAEDEYAASRQEVNARITNGEMNEGSWKKLMNLLLLLRRVCDHPYLLAHAEPNPFSIGEHIIASSSKLVFIDKLLKDILPKGEKVLLFSQWTGMLDNLEDMLYLRGIPYARLDGSSSRPRRALDIRLFQQDDDRVQVFVISTTAGGLGINLTKATTVVMCDSSWNPQMDLQAIARAHRIGQKKTVKVYRLLCQGSVEDQMQDRIRRKLYLSLKIMGSSNGPQNEEDLSASLGATELLDILRRGTGALASEKEMEGTWALDDFFKAPVEDIISASQVVEDARWAKLKKTISPEEMNKDEVQNVEQEETRLLAGIAQVRSRMWEGELIQPITDQSHADIRREWDGKAKRARSEHFVMFNGIKHISRPEKVLAIPGKPKAKKPPLEHEEWCMYCRDGGELGCCRGCPKVFHARCIGISARELASSPGFSCSHHSCARCTKTTAQSGGMLFRCRTCTQAFCEDCLPEKGIEYIGDTVPEHLVLNYAPPSVAYYIRCHDCIQYHKKNPQGKKEWKEWLQEFKEAEIKLAKRNESEVAVS